MRLFPVVFLSILPGVRSCGPTPATPADASSGTADDWFLSGGGRYVYDLSPDPGVPYDGAPSTELSAEVPTNRAYGTAMQSVDAAPYRGRRLRVWAPVRTEGVTERGDFWVRAQGPRSPSDGPGLGGGREALVPTAAFATYDVVFRVPEEAVRIEIGAGIAGPGRLWLGPASWEVLAEPESPASAVGVWSVVWDRSETRWSPPLFRGTLVLEPDRVGLDWIESSGALFVRSYTLDGPRFHLELGWDGDPTSVSVMEGVVDGDTLTGTVEFRGPQGRVPPSPLHGARVPMLEQGP
jgi:hypothetical protein